MLSMVKSIALTGVEGQIVTVEVDVSLGLPGFNIVGLPDAAVRESTERVRAAIKNSGLEFPMKRITVNLAPADLRKEGPAFDLPIALGILAATQQLAIAQLAEVILLGELSLDGSIRPITGVLPAALTARQKNFKGIMVPELNAREAALIRELEVYPATSLKEIITLIQTRQLVNLPWWDSADLAAAAAEDEMLDFSDVKGQPLARRALEIAAAGGHNLLMVGPPGSGKTMLARRLPTILPSMSLEEAFEVTKIYSLAGRLQPDQPLVTTRPFRSPHHNASTSSLTGGGRIPKPGEITLAHQGVLYLDEMPEFHREALEALRQPLEDGVVTISRVQAAITYPAHFQLIASYNPCPCGFFGDPSKACSCTPGMIQRYLNKLSGPLMDRIDLNINVPRLDIQELNDDSFAEPSEAIRKRVETAREIQRERFQGTAATCNARMTSREVRKHCALTTSGARLMREAFRQLQLSARVHDRLKKVARTIADLAGCEGIEEIHIAEALQYRGKSR